MKIGDRLRELRSRRKLSVRAVALRSGISHSSISLIERDLISPSLDTLHAVLDALGTTLSGFFLDFQTVSPPNPFCRAADMTEIGRVDAISYRVIGSGFPNRSMLMLHETYAPGADTGEAFSHSAQEGGMVIRGAVEVTVAGRTSILEPGDGYYFDSREPHRFRNASKEQSEIVSAITPPTY
ncbi:cupin domain-containing protein [Bosea sp. CCNWLW174]|jgi:transcriptional regulator with XRE-family HTH domain|uniref:Helix-turn-helix domain-containing protein n=2 Tax=Boseaceae TaxID=2831100 RepID=A0A1H7YEK8_9HYPH|nr:MULTISPECIES: cupin domain-containing protein [Bosea]SEM43728.1 Helix-turn-helix domain-containing protein [Bosea lupini]